jgi:hypothetical protein
VRNFYGTEIEIWAGFGPVGSNEKKYKQFFTLFPLNFAFLYIIKH